MPHAKLLWEQVVSSESVSGNPLPRSVTRARVPGGWLVYVELLGGVYPVALTYVPDPKNEWR